MAETPAAQSLFRYRAREEATGRMQSGEQMGADAYAVRAALRRIGLAVEHIEPVSMVTTPVGLHPLRQLWLARQRRRRRALRIDVFDALATMLAAGLSLDAAMSTLITSPVRTAAERRMLTVLREHLRAGSQLSDACATHPDWFDALDVAMIRAGQEAGDLIPILRSLSDHHQRIGGLAHKFFTALAYPTLLLLLAVGVVVFLGITTLPQLVTIITDAGHAPPTLTVAVIAIGRFIALRWYLVVVGMILLIALGWALHRLIPPRSWLGLLLANTVLAKARRRSRIANFAQTLARLLASGLPLVVALDAVADAADSKALRQLVADAAAAVRGGGTLSATVAAADLMDPEFAQLMRLGEDSGELPAMLDRVAERYQRIADRSIERLALLLEPIAILVLAALIGTVAFAAIQPLMLINQIL